MVLSRSLLYTNIIFLIKSQHRRCTLGVIRLFVVFLLCSLVYMVAYQRGFNNGFSLAKCEGLSYSEFNKCLEAIR